MFDISGAYMQKDFAQFQKNKMHLFLSNKRSNFTFTEHKMNLNIATTQLGERKQLAAKKLNKKL